MPGARRAKKGQTGRRPNPQIRTGKGEGGGVQTFDDRENKGSVPYSRPPAEVEGPGKIIKGE